MKSKRRSTIHRNQIATAKSLRLEVLEDRNLLAADFVISEFMASNQGSLLDDDGDSSDWIEISNVGDETASLDGWYLTDKADDLTKWRLSDVTVNPGSQQLVFASNKNREQADSPLHTNFRLSADGEYLALVQPDGRTIQFSYAPTYPPQTSDVAYGIGVDSQTIGFILEPTPGEPNVTASVDAVPRPIVINEIMYHPSSENNGEEFIELHNHGEFAVSLADWRLDRGVNYSFPESAAIEPGGFLIVAADPITFSQTFPGDQLVYGPWDGQLSNSGELIRLSNAQGITIDEVTFADEGDWSQRKLEGLKAFGWLWSDDHDGGGKTLELDNPKLSNDYGQNWGASDLDLGTPGEQNSRFSANVPPLILDAQHSPVIPTSEDPVIVSAKLLDEATNSTATLYWRLDGQPEFTSVPMSDDGNVGLFTAAIPPHESKSIIEFYIESQDSSALSRTWPAPNEEHWSTLDSRQNTNMLYQVDDEFDRKIVNTPGSPPVYFQIMTAAERETFESSNRESDFQRNATLISVTGAGTQVRHNIGVRYRGSGSRRANPPNNRLNIPSDRPLDGKTAINMNVVSVEDQVLGSLLFRLAGLAAAEAQPAVMYSNGVNLRGDGGVYAQVEPLGSDFVKNQFPLDDDGNLYNGRRPNESPPGGKGAGLAYFGEEPEPYVSYLKQTNESEADWSDVINLTRTLNDSTDNVYLTAIEEVIDVEQWLRHLALNALLSNREKGLVTGDPLGDDYAMYSGAKDPRFELIPHDLDSLFDPAQVERSLFLPRGVPALKRLLDHPQILPRYYAQLANLIENVLLTENTTEALRNASSFILDDDEIEKILKFLDDRSEFVLDQIPQTQLSVVSDLPVVGEFPRTASNATSLQGQASLATQSVTANGLLADIDFSTPTRDWTISANLPLRPGVNRVVVEAFAEPDGSGQLLDSTTIDIWYETESVQDISGILPAGETSWVAALGPYRVTDLVTVPDNAKLVIEPGTTIYFEPGTGIDVRGILSAQGSQYERIRFTSVPNADLVHNTPNGSNGLPDAPPHWRGIRFQDTNSPDNLIAHADIEYAQDLDGSISVRSSTARIDDVTFRGTHLRMIRSDSASLIIENSYFPDMFAAGESPDALGLDNVAEHIKSTGKPPADGHFIIRNNVFGTNKGHNDVIDADSGRRPDPILEVIDNVFLGAGDEQLDLGGDVYVAGNHFMNIFKDDETSDRGYANAISTGDAGSNTTVVAVRNTFWEVDHAINLKRGAATIFENNTVVSVHADFEDRFGHPNVGSAINLYVDEVNAVPGWGAYAARNVFYDVPRVFGNADLPDGDLTPLELHDNLLTPDLALQSVGAREGTILDLGEGNYVGDSRFRDAANGDFGFRLGSAALQPVDGIPVGADVADTISIWGEPPRGTGIRTTVLSVGGPGIFAYRYRVNGGPWSDDIPIGTLGFNPAGKQRIGQIELNDLPVGRYSIEVLGQDFAGNWQTEPTVSKTWTVQSEPNLIISEVLANNSGAYANSGSTPDYIELQNIGGSAINLNGFRLSDDAARRDKFTFTSDIVIQPGEFLLVHADANHQLPGIHTGFGLNADGENVILSTPNGQVVDSVRFGQQIENLSISRLAPSQTWQLSVPTPSAQGQQQQTGDPAQLRINEWLAIGSAGNVQDEFVELYNSDTLPVSLEGLFLTSELGGNPTMQRLNPLSFVRGQGVVTFQANSPNGLGFELSAEQEVLALLDEQQNTIDTVAFYSQVKGVSQGRATDGGSRLASFVQPSPNELNSPPVVGDIDGDGSVGFSDFLVLSANFGSEDSTRDEGDLDGDGRVGFADFLVLSTNFGR